MDNYKEYEIKTSKQTAIVREYIPTEQELQEKDRLFRINELKESISNKKLLDIDCTEEKNELKVLLGL